MRIISINKANGVLIIFQSHLIKNNYNVVRAVIIVNYSRTPEIETADLSQSHAGLNFRLIVYYV